MTDCLNQYNNLALCWTEEELLDLKLCQPDIIDFPAHTVCFTGHRAKKLCGYTREPYRAAMPGLIQLVKNLYREGYRIFITGMAQGFDQLVFWAVEHAKKAHPDIISAAFVPFPSFGRNWSETSAFGRRDLALLRKKADIIHNCAPGQTETSRHTAIELLDVRNKAMLSNASLCIAFQDIGENGFTGGTRNMIRDAKRHSVSVRPQRYFIHDAQLCLM